VLWLEGLGQLKNPVTSSGIKPATFQLVGSASTNYASFFTEALDVLPLYMNVQSTAKL
jgi:hypothetical protein